MDRYATRMRFRLGQDVASILSTEAAQEMVGKEVPVGWANEEGVKATGRVIEVLVSESGIEVVMEVDLPATIWAHQVFS